MRASGLEGMPLQPLSKDVLVDRFFVPIARVQGNSNVELRITFCSTKNVKDRLS